MDSLSAQKTLLVLLAVAACTAPLGCAPVSLRGNGFGDKTANWADKLRPTTQPGNLAGFDTRAREVEQNLGVR